MVHQQGREGGGGDMWADFALGGHWTDVSNVSVSRDDFDCHNWRVLLASGEESSLLTRVASSQQGTGQPPPTKPSLSHPSHSRPRLDA